MYWKCHMNVRSCFSGWWGKRFWVTAEYQSFKLGYCCTLGECCPKAIAALGFLGWAFLFGDSVTTLLEKLLCRCRKLLVVALSYADTKWYQLFLWSFFLSSWIRVTAEVKHNPTNTIVCKAQGEWNGTLEFTYSNGETKVIDTNKLPVIRKKIRPIAKQGPLESR